MEVRTPGGKEKKKKKQNRNRETFVSEAADISKNLTYTQGGGPAIENVHIRPLWWSLGPPSLAPNSTIPRV